VARGGGVPPNTRCRRGWQYAGLAQRQTLAAVIRQARRAAVDIGNLAIAVLLLDATPPPAIHPRYMATSG
jgi:hypothetical protein